MARRHSTSKVQQHNGLIPAVGYLRVSSDKQEKSIPEQRREIEQYAAAHGYLVVDWYVDDGISGDETEKRLDFQRMCKDAEKGTFQAIIVWDQDRFGRFSPQEASYWTFPLAKAGVRLVTVADGPVDWSDFIDWLTFSVKQHGKHQFLHDLSRNLTRGRIESAMKGRLCGQAAPYGYDRMYVDASGRHIQRARNGEVPKMRDWGVILVPSDDPQKRETVRWLFNEYASKDVSLRTLAIELINRGVPGPSGRKWYEKTIQFILRNEAYVGTFVYAKRGAGKYNRITGTTIAKYENHWNAKLVVKPEDEWIRVPSAREALIDAKTFKTVQAKLEKRRSRTTPKKDPNAYPLTGLIWCANCGGRMCGTTHRKAKNGKQYVWSTYICSTYQRIGRKVDREDGCFQNPIRQQHLFDLIVAKLRAALHVDANEKVLLERIRQRLEARQNGTPDQRKQVEKRLAELDQLIRRSTERLLRVDDETFDLLREQVSELQTQRKALAAELASLDQSRAGDVGTDARTALNELRSIRADLLNSEPARFREVLRRLINRVELSFEQVPQGKRGKRKVSRPVAGRIVLLRSHLFTLISRDDRI